ncbi:MAG: cellulase family glycosylhydrolase [Micromonosporaceae bacterium]
MLTKTLSIRAAALALIAATLALVASAVVLVPSVQARQPGFQISDGRLLDANGNEFVMRGVSHPHVWYPQHTQAYADIKSHGANAVRVVLGSGKRWGPSSAADVADVVSRCRQHRLICVLEVHDTTGYGEDGAAATLDEAVDYWISVRDALVGQEAYVLVNIGNEPYGNNQAVNANWASDSSGAIRRLRAAGLEHTLVVDAPNWGQDWQFIMRDNARSVFDSDPQANTLFSIHMYGVFQQAATIRSYLDSFVTAGLPIMIGEFGHNHSDGDPDEDTIMSYAETLGVGYIGWSWSGNGGGVAYLDMVEDFDTTRLTWWGQRIFHGADGIALTAREASVYGTPPSPSPSQTTSPSPTGSPSPTASPTMSPTVSPTGSPPGDAACRVSYVVRSEWNTGFTADVTITNLGVATSGWTLGFGFPGDQRITNGWSATWSQDGAQVTARSLDWNANLPTGGATTVGFNGSYSGSNPTPADFTLNGRACAVA